MMNRKNTARGNNFGILQKTQKQLVWQRLGDFETRLHDESTRFEITANDSESTVAAQLNAHWKRLWHEEFRTETRSEGTGSPKLPKLFGIDPSPDYRLKLKSDSGENLVLISELKFSKKKVTLQVLATAIGQVTIYRYAYFKLDKTTPYDNIYGVVVVYNIGEPPKEEDKLALKKHLWEKNNIYLIIITRK